MSGNYENSYALNNMCNPCHLMGGNGGGRPMYGGMRTALANDRLPMTGTAQVSHYQSSNPYLSHRSRVASAIIHDVKSGTVPSAHQTQQLAGYTGGTRTAFGQN